MYFQKTNSECSVASLQNALAFYNDRLSRRRAVKGLCSLTDCHGSAEGFDQQDIQHALGDWGYTWDECQTSQYKEAYRWLWVSTQVAPVLLCVDNWNHWVCVAGPCNMRLCLMDPSNEEQNIRIGGVTWPRVETIVRRWRAARRNKKQGELYYGMALFPASKD